MKIKFFGTGAAFTLKNYQTNLGIQIDGKWLLLDAGGDIRFSLKEAGLSYKDIDALYLSHLHADHAGGLEYLGFCTFFDPSCSKIALCGNGELLRRAWGDTLKGGMESVQGRMLTLDDFFIVNGIRPNDFFKWKGITFRPVQSVHIMNGYSLAPCYGLMIEQNEKKLFWTADCQFCPNQIMDFYKQADMIIQDCETAPFKSGVHAHFSELCTLPADIKKKMILVHYQDNVFDDDGIVKQEWIDKVKEAEFLCMAPRGMEVDF